LFITYTELLPGWVDGFHFMHEFVKDPAAYKLNTYNRLKFWILVPPGIDFVTDGDNTFQFGTFVRCSGCDITSQESGGNHYYHNLNLGYTGAWHQVIIDTHPSHQRGAEGFIEWGNQPYPTCSTAATPGGMLLGGGSSADCGTFNAFDANTQFYIDSGYTNIPSGSNFYIDSFELYQEMNDENVDQIYSLNGVYVPGSNTIRLGWNRRKDEDPSIAYEVRYSSTDVFKSGWDAATPAPSGTVTSAGGAYNTMFYVTDQINVTGLSQIYMAIKPTNSNKFRQIVIPIR
jgi:hypothetical protein